MKRWSLPEIEDQPWCPEWLRAATTGYLQRAIALSRPYAPAAPVIADLLREAGAARVVDLCSGAGGPWRDLRPAVERELGRSVELVLTDRHPNLEAAAQWPDGAPPHYERESVSALAVPARLCGLRTMFTALHHFEPADVETLLRAARGDRVAFAAFEATQRSWKGVLLTLFIPLLVLALVPGLRPLRWQTLVFTYVLPVIPLAVWWDGLASTLKTYRPDEIASMVRSLSDETYGWSVCEVPIAGVPIPMLQVIGRPRGA